MRGENAWLLISGGRFEPDCLAAVLHEKQFSEIVAIDGGAAYCRSAGLRPTLAVGDFDTIDHGSMDWLLSEKVPLHSLPCQKDMTDTAAAVELAISRGVTQIHLVAGMGSRFDHSYGNLLLLTKAEQAGVALMLHSTGQRLRLLIPGRHQLTRDTRYPYLSFFAWMGPVEGLSLTGLAYSLTDYRLCPEDPLCISNTWGGMTATVDFREGRLLMVEACDEA